MLNLWNTILDLVGSVGNLTAGLFWVVLAWALMLSWAAWWLFAVNWRKLWPALAKGAWAPVVLLGIISALMWASLAPGILEIGDSAYVPNFLWQSGIVALLIGSAGFCGWLQGQWNLTPGEMELFPAAQEH